jgi:outer membrane receptor for ferrienterochelin and colicin
MLEWNHTLSAKTFYTLKFSHNSYDRKSYLYENPDDPRYVNPEILRTREDAYSFLTGGTNMLHEYRSANVAIGKFDITSQVTKIHQVKGGFEYKYNKIEENNFEANYRGVPGGGIFSEIAFFNKGKFSHDAIEAAVYIQDRIELDHMTLNVGLRYDYFDSRGQVPEDLRAPDLSFTGADVQHQWSPRIGFAFPITEQGVVHASYGHFFQIPPYEFLYKNPNFAVAPGGLSTLMGNADLKPQSTIIYELGFQQGLFEQLAVDVTGFYKDVRNLIGTKIYETYILGDRYARYENLDYGNIRGITLSVNKRPTSADHVTISFDYTFQVVEGNASDPNHEFNNQQSFPPKKSNIQVVPLDWDQRHTINLSFSYHNPRIISAGLIWQLQSGVPYTPAIQNIQQTFENSGRKPFISNVDLRIAREFNLFKSRFNIFLKIYNLLDRRNEIDVYQDTGRAGYSLVSHYTGERNTYINTLDEWIKRPDFYSEPRKILIGFSIDL